MLGQPVGLRCRSYALRTDPHDARSGEVERLMLGEVEELWDAVAIAKYPSRAAMGEMIGSPEYQAIEVHRSAGLAGQLNIECV